MSYNRHGYEIVINLNYPLNQGLCCQKAVALSIHSRVFFLSCSFFILYWKSLPLYPRMLQPHIASSSTSRSICSLFLCLSIRVPWFPWDWILSQIMPEGGLSCMDPLGSTALCRGSEVWEMWCILPRGCTSAVFSDDLTGACGSMVHYSHIRSCKHTSISTTAHVQVEDQGLLNACLHQIWFLYYSNDLTTSFICFNFIRTIS